jgi:phage tail-like protein
MKREAIEELLPAVFRQTSRPGSPLRAILESMEELHAPPESVLAELDRYFDPYRTPDSFVPFLARWMDLTRLFQDPSRPEIGPNYDVIDLGRLRELIAAAARLARWRGTPQGLLTFLTIATGVTGFEIEEGVAGDRNEPRPFHIKVRITPDAEPYRQLCDRIVRLEKPAYVTYELDPQASARQIVQ